MKDGPGIPDWNEWHEEFNRAEEEQKKSVRKDKFWLAFLILFVIALLVINHIVQSK